MIEFIGIFGPIVMGAVGVGGASVTTYLALSPSTQNRPLAGACAVAFGLAALLAGS